MATQKKKKKKKKSYGKVYLFLILAVLIVGGIVILTSGQDKGNDPVTPAPAPVTGDEGENPYADADDEDSTYKTVTEADLVDVDNLSVTPGLDETWRNILLLGVDTRDFNTWGRSDSMIIASINTQTGAVKMCSILRDTWVNIPGVGEERINVAYQYGGPELAVKTVNELFHLNIEEYVVVNFSTMPHIIESIGGVEINVKNKEVPYINQGVGNSIWYGKILNLDESDLSDEFLPEDAEGDLVLTGRQALAYARIRKLDSDFMRTSRQRTVISAAMVKFRDQTDTATLMALANSVLGYVKTNINMMTMVGISLPVIKSGITNMYEMRIPIDESYVYESRNFVEAFYNLDVEANAAELHAFIYDN